MWPTSLEPPDEQWLFETFIDNGLHERSLGRRTNHPHFNLEEAAVGACLAFGFTVELEPSRPVILHLSCRSSLSCKHSQASASSVPTCTQTSWEMTTSWNRFRHRPVRRWWCTAGGSASYSRSFFLGVFPIAPPLHVIQWPCLSCLRIGLYTSCCLLLLTYHLQISDRSALAQRPRPIHPSCTQRMIALRLYFCFLLCRVAVTCLYCLSEGSVVNVLSLLFSSSVLIDSQ